MIRLVALDLDQTIFGIDLSVSDRVRQTIANVQKAGVVVTIATGRDSGLASRFARELQITAPIICSQGACIYDHMADQVLHDVRLSMDVARRILDGARRYGWNIHFEASGQIYFPKESNHSPVVFELLRYSKWARVVDLIRDLPEPPSKVVVTLDRVEDQGRVVAEMQAELGDCLTILPSHPHLVEGPAKGVHKGHGVAWLADSLGIARIDVMAVGDSEADIPMIEWAGVGVAMGNGSAAAKAAADWIAPTLEEDGAAVAIERFALNLPGADK